MVPGETCPTGSSSAAGIAFYEEGNYPGYAGALFFADYSRDCIWAMPAGANGLPNPAAPLTFAAAAANPVGLEIGPEGDLFYADFDGGTIRRIRYFSANRPPVAVATANPTAGAAPLNVTFNGTGSSDPDAGDTISYAWDLDEDGLYDDSTAAAADPDVLHDRRPRRPSSRHRHRRGLECQRSGHDHASATRRRRRRSRRPPQGRPGASGM